MSDTFRVLVLGCGGGPQEDNLSGYLLYPTGTDHVVALDAGTMLAGIEAVHAKGNLDDFKFTFSSLSPVGEVFQKKLKAYLISHAHLDHIAGLVINSQIDTHKHILGIEETIKDLKDSIFNWVTWPNCANEGKKPFLNRYDYVQLPLHERVEIPRVQMHVETHLLSHPHDYPSSAFLIDYQDAYVLYFGDTSPDAIEESKHMHNIWERVAPLYKEGKLKGIFLECSVPDADSGQVVYGHLNPQMFMQEFKHFQEIVGEDIAGLKVIVTHRKQSLFSDTDQVALIETELQDLNKLNLNLIFPTKGDKIIL